MKTIAFALFGLIILIACSSKQTETKESKNWPKLEGYHMVMADAFHPYKDSGNLEPARRLAKELTDSASAWANAPLPEKVNNDEMKGKLQKLFMESALLLSMSKDGSVDSVFAAKLSLLHDVFHGIQEDWYGAGKEEKEHDHH